MGLRWVRAALLLGLLVQAAAVAWLVLNPSPAVGTESVESVSGWLLERGIGDAEQLPGVVEFALNVVLLLPAGAMLSLLCPGVPRLGWLVLGAGVGTAIEAIQLVLLDARTPSGTDVLANALGLGIGGLVGRVVGRSADHGGHRG